MNATDGSPAPGLAVLRTPGGDFLIQERRAVPRDPAAPKAPDPKPLDPKPLAPALGKHRAATTPAMAALGGLIILGVLIGSYTVKYDLAIGHRGGPLAVPAIGAIVLQVFLARAAFRLFDEAHHMPGPWAYIEQRILRYFPATIPAVFIGFGVSWLADLPLFQSPLSSLPANLTMSADFGGVPEIDPSHWRLKIELMFSFLTGALWFTRIRTYLPLILLSGLILSVLHPYGEPVREHTLTWFGLVTADGYVALLAFGIVLHQLLQKSGSLAWQIVAAMTVILVFLSNDRSNGFWVLGSLAVLMAVAAGRCGFLGKMTWLVHLGNLAFPVYVVHYVLGFALIHMLESRGFSSIAASLAASVAVILLGWVIHVLCERPALKHGPAIFQAVRRLVLAYPVLGERETLMQAE